MRELKLDFTFCHQATYLILISIVDWKCFHDKLIITGEHETSTFYNISVSILPMWETFCENPKNPIGLFI